MFVRWKSKSLVRRKNETLQDRLKYAQLVQTSWDTGKPRQKVIKYLASIRESQMDSMDHRRQFWKTVQSKLGELELESDMEQQIISKLEETISVKTN